MMVTMMKTGLSMALMSCLISIGSFVLQTAINGLGNSYIVAQSAARRITEILMSVFVAIGHTMATYCSQNLGADRWDRIHEGMKAGYWITCLWCVLVLVIVYTLAPTLICMITGSSDLVMIHAATQYLRIDSILYVLVAVIFVQRNSMQGIGDTVTPLISSGIEMAGKIILAFTLVPALGYFGVILVEPIVWIVMIIPLILKVRTWER
jgi:Na+-driven multidrug efflux pump